TILVFGKYCKIACSMLTVPSRWSSAFRGKLFPSGPGPTPLPGVNAQRTWTCAGVIPCWARAVIISGQKGLFGSVQLYKPLFALIAYGRLSLGLMFDRCRAR